MQVQPRSLRTQLIFVLLQIGDVITTLVTLRNGGIELNPLVARLMTLGGLQGLFLSKVVLLAVAVAATRLHRLRVLVLANVVFGAVVLWNLSVIVRLYLRFHAA